MALPPKGDPRRPLHLAIRSTRVLGVLFLLFGSCGLVPFLMRGGGGGAPPVWLASVTLVYFVPGVLFILSSVFLGQHKLWAVVGALVLTVLCVLFVLFGLVTVLIAASTADMPPLALVISLGIFGLILLAMGQLIYHLVKSFESIRHPPFGYVDRGFEPLPVSPVVGPSGLAPAQPAPPPDAPYGAPDRD